MQSGGSGHCLARYEVGASPNPLQPECTERIGATDPFGARVSSDNGDSLIGRLGVSADKPASWKDDAGQTRRSNIYGIANLYYEFLGATQVDVSGTKLESGPEKLWGGVGVGGSYNWNNDKYSVYAEVSANTSLQNFGNSYALNGTVGLRVRW